MLYDTNSIVILLTGRPSCDSSRESSYRFQILQDTIKTVCAQQHNTIGVPDTSNVPDISPSFRTCYRDEDVCQVSDFASRDSDACGICAGSTRQFGRSRYDCVLACRPNHRRRCCLEMFAYPHCLPCSLALRPLQPSAIHSSRELAIVPTVLPRYNFVGSSVVCALCALVCNTSCR